MAFNLACWCTPLTYLGGAVAALFLVRFLLWFKLNFLTSVDLKKKYRRAGNWAVVTGASDGIGKAFAIELARRGFSIVLMARTESKLREVAEQCVSKSAPIETKVIPFDFGTATTADYAKVGKALQALDVAILVNNVGINYDHPMFFDEVDVATDLNVMKVNMESQVNMTKLVLPKMKEKRSGLIINLGSFSRIVNAPLLSIYAATKSFNETFSKALATEVAKQNIDVFVARPGMVISSMSKRTRETFDCCSASATVKAILKKAGNGVRADAGHVRHTIIEWAVGLLPGGYLRGTVLGQMIATKKKAEKKAAAAAAATSGPKKEK